VVRRFRAVRRPRMPVSTLARYTIEEARLFISEGTGTGRTSVRYYGMNRPDFATWLDLQRGSRLLDTSQAYEEIMLLKIVMGWQFGDDYWWHVHLKAPGAKAGVLLPTTITGVRELFKLRDYEAGESRRKALTHWVNGHTRRIRKETPEEQLVWVRDHLRGRLHFTWDDLEGDIRPSGYDIKRLAKLRGAV